MRAWGWGLAAGRDRERPGRAAAFEIRRLDRVGQALPQVLAVELHAIDDDLQRRPVRAAPPDRRRRTRTARPSTSSRPKPLRRSAVERRGDGGRASRPPVAARGAGSSARRRRVVVRARRARRPPASSPRVGRRRVDDRQVEADAAAACPPAARRAARATTSAVSRTTSRPQLPAERAADAREQQPHVVVNLGRRADGRARVADAVLLADRDRRRDAVDAIDVRLLHPLEELPGVGRQRLDVAPLPFGVDRVEGERRLARPADAGDDDQLADGQRQIDVLEVVRARAAHDDVLGFSGPGDGRIGHERCTTLQWCFFESFEPPMVTQGRTRRKPGDHPLRRAHAIADVVASSTIGTAGLPPRMNRCEMIAPTIVTASAAAP